MKLKKSFLVIKFLRENRKNNKMNEQNGPNIKQ